VSTPVAAAVAADVTFGEALRVWARIGLLSFGGPAGQIALMHKELVERLRWIDEERFLHALNYCTLLPGPEAQQLATYIGWLMHKTRGGLAAGILFVLPGFVSILVLSVLYATLKTVPAIAAVFFGLKSAVLAVVVEAVMRIGKRALNGRPHYAIAALAFVAIFFFEVPFPLVVLAAGASGLALNRIAAPVAPPASGGAKRPDTVIEAMAVAGQLAHTEPSPARFTRVLLTCAALWVAPIALLAAVFGPDSVFVTEARFFSQAAMVTFGGAYSVLAYVAQQAVEVYGWLQPGEMLDGLGLAETTPGPLIMVVQFVGFLGGYRFPGALSPLAGGVFGSLITVWVTFVPCFLWIFLGGPYIEALRGNRAARAALSAITAAVVGVVLNLSLWFALHVIFRVVTERHIGPLRLLVPDLATFEPAAAVLSAGAMLAMFRFHVDMPKTLLGCALLGAAWRLAIG
jgi:chromate transporter